MQDVCALAGLCTSRSPPATTLELRRYGAHGWLLRLHLEGVSGSLNVPAALEKCGKHAAYDYHNHIHANLSQLKSLCFWVAGLGGMASPCVQAWLADPILANRATVGSLAILPREFLARTDVIINAEVLIPLIKFHGLRLSVDTIASEVKLFYTLGMPAGKPAMGSCLAKGYAEPCRYVVKETRCVQAWLWNQS